MPKAKNDKKSLRHNPLADQIIQEEDKVGLRRTPHEKPQRRKHADDDEGAEVLPAGVTKKVLEIAQKQKHSDDLDFGEDGDLRDDIASMISAGGSVAGEIDMSDVEVDADGFIVMDGATEDEERALSLFLPGGNAAGVPKPSQTLADVILQKINENQRKADREADASSTTDEMSPKVIQVYGEIGRWLKHYKSGQLPKAFKVVPSLNNWEEVLALTMPLNWSPAAMYEAVNIFASNLNPRMAQRFYNLVLLPAVRQNIAEYKRLNFHYYRALRKAIFKPAAFFKGIVIPLCAENCTLREAALLCSILTKTSLPSNHVAATMVRLCMMTPWFGTTSIVLAALINKKYSLPLQVIEHFVAHFCAFGADDRELPVVWHRALLLFLQRYKFELNQEQKKRIQQLLKVHFHEGMGPEIRRELLAPKPGEVSEPTAKMDVDH